MNKIKQNDYRWLGLAGLVLLVINHWLGSAEFAYSWGVDPIAKLLALVFAFMYLKSHKDVFSVILFITLLLVFVLSITTYGEFYVSRTDILSY